MRRLLGLALLLACCAGCSAPPQVRHDKILRVGLEARPQAFDSRQATDAAASRIDELIYSRLVQYNNRLEVIPDVAESWDIEEGGRRIRFHLHSGIRFQDGSALDASDVAYTFQSILDPNTASPKRQGYDVVERIEVESPQSLVFYLKQPNAAFLSNMNLGIVPEGWKGDGLPVGSGPFRMVENDNGALVRLEAFEGFWGGRPWLDGIEFHYIPDPTMRVLELEKGSIDLVQNDFIPEFVPALRRDPRLKVLSAPGINCSYLGMNLHHPQLGKPEVRRAIASAIDRETIQALILRDTASLAEQIEGPTILGYNPDVRLPAYDPEASRRLLRSAGAEHLSLVYKTSTDKLRLRIAEVIRRNLGEVGIDVRIQPYEFATFFADVKKGNFDLFSLTWVGLSEPDFLYSIFHSSSFPPVGVNRVFYSNPLMDRLLEQGRVELDLTKRQALYAQANALVAEDLPILPLWYTNNVACLHADVEGFELYPGGNYYSMARIHFSGMAP